ncbi:unnamed protein product, partial [Iphiclides podalirius]
MQQTYLTYQRKVLERHNGQLRIKYHQNGQPYRHFTRRYRSTSARAVINYFKSDLLAPYKSVTSHRDPSPPVRVLDAWKRQLKSEAEADFTNERHTVSPVSRRFTLTAP